MTAMTEQRLVIHLPYLPPECFSRNSRTHWRERWQVQHQIRDDVLALLLESGQKPEWPWDTARVTITYVLPDKRRRDGDNLTTSTKPILDALVGVVVADDSLQNIGFPEYRYHYEKGVAKTIITIEKVVKP